MASHAMHQMVESNWSWQRISGLAGSFGLHIAALVLLAIPVAIPTLKPDPVMVIADVFEVPPELPVRPIPPEPVPIQVQRKPVTPVIVQRPAVAEPSVMSVPVTPTVTDVAEPSIEPATTDVAAPATASVSLAYESVTEVRYPIDSRRRGEQGTVMLRVLVGRDGMPLDISVERSSGHRSLDRAARDTVLRWRFRPVQINGVNVQATGLVPIKFDISQG
jgi:periplasmic protein TonB